MNEVELHYDPKIGITNLDDIYTLNTIPKFQEAIKGILKVNINNGFKKRNPRKLCAILLPLLLLLIIGCILMAVLLYPNGFGLVGGTIIAIIFLSTGFCIYKRGTVKYLKDTEKRVLKRTRQTCNIKFYNDNKPYEESIGCFGARLTTNSLIFVTSDPEKLEIVKKELEQEELMKDQNNLPSVIRQIIAQKNQNGQPMNIIIMDKSGKVTQQILAKGGLTGEDSEDNFEQAYQQETKKIEYDVEVDPLKNKNFDDISFESNPYIEHNDKFDESPSSKGI